MGSLFKISLSKLVLSKASFMIPFFYCSVIRICLIVFVILISLVSVIWLLICSNNASFLLNLSLILETFWIGVGNGLLIWGNLTFWLFDCSSICGAIHVKIWIYLSIWSIFLENGTAFSLLFCIRFLTLSLLLKLALRKLISLIRFMMQLSAEVALYFHQSTIWPCMEY